ncbi:hypothetical protein SLE2022_230910 [Rubroshorea leprosula]
MPICGGQVEGGNNVSVHIEGGNNENGTKDVGFGVEAHQTRVVLPSIAEVQLVEVLLSQQFEDMINHRGKGKIAKANKGSWKRLDHAVVSTLCTENNSQNKRRSCLTPMEEERALEVLVDNTKVVLAQLAKGHDPPAG